jgi:hypothetical protein
MELNIKDFRDELFRRFDKLDDKIEAQGKRNADLFMEHAKLLAENRARIEQNAKDVGYAHNKIRSIPKNIGVILGIIVALIAIISFSQKKGKSEEALIPKKTEIESPIKK